MSTSAAIMSHVHHRSFKNLSYTLNILSPMVSAAAHGVLGLAGGEGKGTSHQPGKSRGWGDDKPRGLR